MNNQFGLLLNRPHNLLAIWQCFGGRKGDYCTASGLEQGQEFLQLREWLDYGLISELVIEFTPQRFVEELQRPDGGNIRVIKNLGPIGIGELRALFGI